MILNEGEFFTEDEIAQLHVLALKVYSAMMGASKKGLINEDLMPDVFALDEMAEEMDDAIWQIIAESHDAQIEVA